MSNFLVNFIELFVLVLNLAIFGRAIMSWISPAGTEKCCHVPGRSVNRTSTN